MRVIAGKLKGRNVKAVQGSATRPTGDKIKEAIFHKMGPFFEDGYCLDLFAGSGSLGIEAISRGMDKTIFIDNAPQAIKTIHHNIQTLQIEQQCEVYKSDAFRAIKKLSQKDIRFDLILIDPPYDKMNYQILISEIIKNNIANTDCMIYLEHRPSEESFLMNKDFEIIYEKNYNPTTSITIIQKKI